MTTSSEPGPRSRLGWLPPQSGPTPFVGGGAALGVPDNPDAGPDLFWGGIGLRHPDYLPRIGQGPLSAGGYADQDVGFYAGGPWLLIDQAPAQLGAALLATTTANASVASGTAMTLAAGTGVTQLTSALTILPSGKTVPSGCFVLDGNTAFIGAGQSGAFQFLDPAHALSRTVSLTGASGGTGGAFLVSGYDLYGYPMTATVTLAGGVNTVNSTKAFKYVLSIVPQFTDASHAYSAGIGDVYGLPIRADAWAYVDVCWNNIKATAATGFTAAVTSAASASTGDVRGTYAVQTTGSNGTIKLQVWVRTSVANLVSPSSYASYRNGLLGVSQA